MEVHPIVRFALSQLSRGEREPYVLDSKAAASLEHALRLLLTDPTELRKAIHGLVALAHLIETRKGSKLASIAILRVAERAAAWLLAPRINPPTKAIAARRNVVRASGSGKPGSSKSGRSRKMRLVGAGDRTG